MMLERDRHKTNIRSAQLEFSEVPKGARAVLEWIIRSQYKVQVLVMFSVLPFLGGQWSLGSTGQLTQLSGTSGCISNTGTSGACVTGNGLDGAGWVEISSDGKFVYVASFNSSTVTTF